MNHLDNHHILSDKQHGFRKRQSCETQLIITIEELACVLDDQKQVDLIILDFSEVFDSVAHERLMPKLHHYGIQGDVWQ